MAAWAEVIGIYSVEYVSSLAFSPEGDLVAIGSWPSGTVLQMAEIVHSLPWKTVLPVRRNVERQWPNMEGGAPETQVETMHRGSFSGQRKHLSGPGRLLDRIKRRSW